MARLGVSPKLQQLAHSGYGAWRMAGNHAMQRALSNRVLKQYKFITPSDLDLTG